MLSTLAVREGFFLPDLRVVKAAFRGDPCLRTLKEHG